MRTSLRKIVRLSSFVNSGCLTKIRGRALIIGGGIAMTAVGITVAYPTLALSNSFEEDSQRNTRDLHNSAFLTSLKKLISFIGLDELKAEEKSSRNEKTHPSNVSPLMKTSFDIPAASWDHNWDKRAPDSLVKPLKSNASEEELETHQKKVQDATPTATRTYILVRHGQYEMKDTDEERILTPLGREQANSTGERLAILWNHAQRNNQQGEIDLNYTMSTMARATETAQIIHQHLPNVAKKSCDLIREGAPCEPVPNVIAGMWDPEPHLFFEEGARIEAGFRKYIHRADPSQEKNSIDVLVCHGNVIRYFVCRALQLPPEAWLRFSVHNASITTIRVTPTGRVSTSGVGESGHLTPDKLTFN